MNWAGLGTAFLTASVKFMMAPAAAIPFGLTFWETYFATALGGMFGAAFFYFPADYFMMRAKKKREEEKRLAEEKGIPYEEKKRFTRANRFVVKIKSRLGIIGTSLWVPFFLSIPIGSIITAKFYGKDVRTYPLICFFYFRKFKL